MVEPLRHRQTKGAATAMFYLMPPRHISTLPNSSILTCLPHVRLAGNLGHGLRRTRRGTCSRSGVTLVSWDQRFFDPIKLPGGR